jgi:hypothetical protein
VLQTFTFTEIQFCLPQSEHTYKTHGFYFQAINNRDILHSIHERLKDRRKDEKEREQEHCKLTSKALRYNFSFGNSLSK